VGGPLRGELESTHHCAGDHEQLDGDGGGADGADPELRRERRDRSARPTAHPLKASNGRLKERPAIDHDWDAGRDRQHPKDQIRQDRRRVD
jgi:hypothetical protein